MFIEGFIKIWIEFRKNISFPSVSLVETRIIVGRKDRIQRRGNGREEMKKTWNAKWRERRLLERVRPRTSKIIFSLTRLYLEEENSSEWQKIAPGATQGTYDAVFIRSCKSAVKLYYDLIIIKLSRKFRRMNFE